MSRILVDPNQLQSLASQFDEFAASLQELGRRSTQSLEQTDSVSHALDHAHAQVQEAGRLAAGLVSEAHDLGRGLRQTADRFLTANAWRPPQARVGAPARRAEGAPGSVPAGTPATYVPAAGDPLTALRARFPDPQTQAIMAHLVDAEGMRAPNAAHGGVVYQADDGLRSDRQWLNFGYISFAVPSGTGGDVLQRILKTPGEAEAFREIAQRHLQDQGAGQVPATHSHLLREAGPEIPALSAADQANQFIALVQSGKERALADWFFKYGNEPATEHQVATGHLRPEWDGVMQEFLARPASVTTQLETIDQNYLRPAIQSATQFGFHSEKAVAWFVDQHVQSGELTDDMQVMLHQSAPAPGDPLLPLWQRFQAGDEPERLQVLTELSDAPGTTVRNRRESVLADPTLTWATFKKEA